jgi:hypothetical protein
MVVSVAALARLVRVALPAAAARLLILSAASSESSRTNSFRWVDDGAIVVGRREGAGAKRLRAAELARKVWPPELYVSCKWLAVREVGRRGGASLKGSCGRGGIFVSWRYMCR